MELSHHTQDWQAEKWEDWMAQFLLRKKRDCSVPSAKPPNTAVLRPTGLLFDPLQKAEVFAETYEVQYDLHPQDFPL